jgi:hypothetical protein
MKECKDDEIRNPKTHRCVKRDGFLGKKILSESKLPKATLKTNDINLNKTMKIKKSKKKDQLYSRTRCFF